MQDNTNFRPIRRTLKATLMAGAGALACSTTAAAQALTGSAPLKLVSDYIGYGISVSPRASYTNNIELASDGSKEEDYALSTMFSAAGIVSTPRVTAIGVADVDLSYIVNQEEFVVNQNVGATSTFTGVDNWLYLDVTGNATRQLAGETARVSTNMNAARGARANVYSFSASPYIHHEFPNQSAVELRYGFAQLYVDDADSEISGDFDNYNNNSRTHMAVARYDTGDSLGRLRLNIGAFGRDTLEDGSDVFTAFEYQQGGAYVEPEFALTRRISISGAVGYDEVDLGEGASLFFDEDALSGVYWRAGLTARPSRQTLIQVEYGDRYGDDFVEANIRHDVTPRIRLFGSASRSFETRNQGINDRTRSAQLETLDFADRLRAGDDVSARGLVNAAGLVASTIGGANAQAVGVGVTDEASVGALYFRERTSVGFSARNEDNDFGYAKTEVLAFNLNGSRQLNRSTSLYASAEYRKIDVESDPASCIANPAAFGIDATGPGVDIEDICRGVTSAGGENETVSGTLGVSYRLYENVALFGEATHTQRFADEVLEEYDETTATIGLTLDF